MQVVARNVVTKNNKQQARIFEAFKVPLARNSKRSCDISMKILALVVKDLQPFSIVEDEGFVNLLAYFEPRYQPISRKYLTENLLATKYREGTTALKTVNIYADCTSLTTDSWTSNSTEDFVTVTLLVHVLSVLVLSCYVLDTSPLLLAHTAWNLSAHFTFVC